MEDADMLGLNYEAALDNALKRIYQFIERSVGQRVRRQREQDQREGKHQETQ